MSNCHHNQHSQSHHCCQITTSGAHQSLDELEFERGIWSAAQDGELERLYKLVAKGADVNCCDKSGYTALHYAARSGHVDVCSYLLSQGADINAVTRAGKATPLHRACTAGKIDVVELLLAKGANALLQDADGKNALHRAAEKSHTIIENMLQKHKDHHNMVQCIDKKGNLPSNYLKS